MDRYFRQQASQDVRRRVSRVFVATGDSPEVVAGYYSLNAASIERKRLPAKLAKRLPHYPVPAAVIGRLAVDRRHHGLRLGEGLLMDAIRRVVRASDSIAVYALMVDAKNERARTFYERYGFRCLGGMSHRLFLPLPTLRKLKL